MNHRLQLFDTPESLGETVASFFLEGYLAGDHLLLIAKPRHRDAILSALRASGCFSPDLEGPQRLVALDAADVLRHISRNGRIDSGLFWKTVRPVVQSLGGKHRLRIYGEIVELLAEQDDMDGAIALEELWNELGEQVPFTLLCGYSSAHFIRSTSLPALRGICRTHSHVTASHDDTLGSYLLTTA